MYNKKVYRAVGIDSSITSVTCETEEDALEWIEVYQRQYPGNKFKVQVAFDWQDKDVFDF